MQQIVVVHGGTTFVNYEEFLDSLENKPVFIDRLTYKPMWKELLQEKLGTTYQVLLPSMPNKTNARYSEWEIYFKNLESVLSDNCILIGHSLGAIFLAKYLSQHTFSKKIKATILIAAPFSDESHEDLTDFKLEEITKTFTEQAGWVECFFGSDDPVIALSEYEQYREQLPHAKFNLVAAPDHFVRVEFPELISSIKSLG